MTWRVQISGERLDIEALSKSFVDDDIRVATEGDNYFLESKRFEGASASGEVLKMAADLLAVLSGVARLAYGARMPLRAGHVFRLRPDGGEDVFVHVTETLHLRAMLGNVTIVTSDGSEVALETPDPARSWAKMADQNEAVSKALRLFGANAKDWVGLYRLWEVIEQDIGGIERIVAAGWATRDSLKRFKHTANSPIVVGDLARHGKEVTQPPKRPMDLSEARSLIEVILHSWLRAKGNANT
jgi:hypothetical protein